MGTTQPGTQLINLMRQVYAECQVLWGDEYPHDPINYVSPHLYYTCNVQEDGSALFVAEVLGR